MKILRLSLLSFNNYASQNEKSMFLFKQRIHHIQLFWDKTKTLAWYELLIVFNQAEILIEREKSSID